MEAAFWRDPDRGLHQGSRCLWDLLKGEEQLVTRKDNKSRKRVQQTNNKKIICASLLTRKVDQNIALGNLSKTYRTFQVCLQWDYFVCLLSLMKSWFFVLSDVLATSWREWFAQGTDTPVQGQEKSNWIPPNPRAQSRTLKDQAWALPIRVQARSFHDSYLFLIFKNWDIIDM